MQLKNAVKNSFFGVLGQVILIAVGFFYQRTMNLLMGAELVGINGVISNVISLLSVSELGIATAVVYHLYAAIARGDETEIAALMNLYRRAYYIFASVIFVLGMLFLPFVHLFLKNTTFSLGYIRLIFLLWLVRTALSYLLSYKRSVLIADQREYVVSIVTLLVNVLNYSLTILILYLTRNYPLALGLNIVIEVASNIWIAAYVNKKYPFLVRLRKETVQKNIFHKVINNVKDIFAQRLFSKLLVSTDSLIISGFISAKTVGLYSNYAMVTQSVINIILSLSRALRPSLGHLFLGGDKDKDDQVLRQLSFFFFLIVSAASSCIFTMITPFVTDIWLNEEYGMDMMFVCVLVFKFFLMTMGFAVETVISVTGLFDRERNISVAVAVVNLGSSLILVHYLGLKGVVLGTSIAYVVQILCRVRVLFREYLMRSGCGYLMELAQYAGLTILEIALASLAAGRIYQKGSIVSFFLTAVVSGVLSLGINILLFARSRRMRSMLELVKEYRRTGEES